MLQYFCSVSKVHNGKGIWWLPTNNPFLNSIIYDVEFPDGQVKEYAANIIAENMLTQVDSDGMSTTLMEAIVDH